MALFTFEPDVSNIHGRYARQMAPVLTVEPGDTVRFRTPDVTWGLEQHRDAGSRRIIEPRDIGIEGGPAMCGPVAVKGAQPGMALELRFEAIEPGDWGWTWVGPGHFTGALRASLGMEPDAERMMRWRLDADAGIGINEQGHRVTLAPFMGTVGVSPGEDRTGWHPSACGGNMDCKLLTAGSTLWLPIRVPGALFSIGDGHARQGDGEVGGSAIECPMRRVDVGVGLRSDLKLTAPLARTSQGWVTVGVAEDLDAAIAMAMGAMLDWMVIRLGVDRVDALALASVAVDLRLTQVVNGVRGVHAVWPEDAITIEGVLW